MYLTIRPRPGGFEKFCRGEMKGSHLVQIASGRGITRQSPCETPGARARANNHVSNGSAGLFVIDMNVPSIVESLHEQSGNKTKHLAIVIVPSRMINASGFD